MTADTDEASARTIGKRNVIPLAFDVQNRENGVFPALDRTFGHGGGSLVFAPVACAKKECHTNQ